MVCTAESGFPMCGSDGKTYPSSCHLDLVKCKNPTLKLTAKIGACSKKYSIIAGAPNLGDARGLQLLICWVNLHQWGVTDVRGEADTKRLGTPAFL
jgi:hypothetical protein